MERKIKTNSKDVDKRINETKREIAELSDELERLINSNVTKSKSYLGVGEQDKYIEDLENATKILPANVNSINQNTIQNDGGLVKKHFFSPKLSPMTSTKDLNTKSRSPAKVRSYDTQAAKQYIKQQRERREEQRKNMNSKIKIDQEIKKQKLHELQQKSLALVQRNIQMKQKRSRSRENRGQVAIDRNRRDNQFGKSNNLTPNLKTSTVTNSIPCINKFDVFTQNVTKREHKKDIPNGLALEGPVEVDSQQNLLMRSRSSPNCQELLKNMSHPRKFATNSSMLCHADQCLAACKIQAAFRGYRVRKQLKLAYRAKSEHCIMTDNCVKESKETQTNLPQKEAPMWLQRPTIDPYPCNFINTIKRKLQFVVNSPVNCREIGIQSSLVGSCGNTTHESSKENAKHSLKSYDKNDLKSFVSHKCSNLDADALKHMALVHRENKSGQVMPPALGKTDSESDTSKNIPEISTESGSCSVLDGNLASEKNSNFLLINTDRLKHLHLRKKQDRCKESADALTSQNGHVDVQENTSKKSYTFNFYEDSKTSKSPEEKFVRSPRDSIISFNKSFEIERNTEDKPVKSPRDSIFSFNISTSSIPKISAPKLDGIKTPNSDAEKRKNCETERSVESSVKSILSHKHSIKDISCNIPKNNATEEYDTVAEVDVFLEDIENSINTSLISHISERGSDSSRISSHNSKHISSKSSLVKQSSSQPIQPQSERSNDENKQKSSEKSSKLSTIPPSIRFSPIGINSEPLNVESTLSAPISTDSSIKCFEDNNVNMKPLKLSDRSAEPSSISISSQKIDNSTNNAVTGTAGLSNSSEFGSLYSSNFSSQKTDTDSNESKKSNSSKVPSNGHPSNDVQIKNNSNRNESNVNMLDTKRTIIQSKSDVNEVHLKFEAEVHLLNDFNESLKQFMAVEEAFKTIKNKNENSCMKFHSKNTQTSKNLGSISTEHSKISTDLSKSILSSINISRGSDISELHLTRENSWKTLENSTGLEIFNAAEQMSRRESSMFSNENVPNNLAGLSINMFEQLIKDEDIRIENLRTIIKIREQALLDRTKGELAWLEIQRKHLKETGRVHEASLVKKKQRGILLKHQQETREMQRLKQLQKIKSNERKTILKEQRNLIKAKLSSEKIMSELKMQSPRKPRTSGPLKVLKSSDSFHSETSVSKNASDGEEVFSITSTHRSIRLSEVESSRELVMNDNREDIRIKVDNKNITHMKKALLLRQAALMKRRKAVEELLQKHQKLLEEEKKIEELEMTANAIIMHIPSVSASRTTSATKLKVKGQQLNALVQKMGTSTGKKFLDDKIYCLSESSYNKLFVDAGNYQLKHKNSQLQTGNETSRSPTDEITNISNRISTTPEDGKQSENDVLPKSINTISNERLEYSEDFELDSQDIENEIDVVHDTDENNLSSISELIQDFSKIEQGISLLSRESDPPSLIVDIHNCSTNSEIKSESLEEPSTIITTKTSPHTMHTGDSLSNKETFEIPEKVQATNDSVKGILLKNDSFESLRDEDISAAIHDMIPSTTSSEISLCLREVEEKTILESRNDEIGEVISKELSSDEKTDIEIEELSSKLRSQGEQSLISINLMGNNKESISILNTDSTEKTDIPSIITTSVLTPQDHIEEQQLINNSSDIIPTNTETNKKTSILSEISNIVSSEKIYEHSNINTDIPNKEKDNAKLNNENSINTDYNFSSKENTCQSLDELSLFGHEDPELSLKITSRIEEPVCIPSEIEAINIVSSEASVDELSGNISSESDRSSQDVVDIITDHNEKTLSSGSDSQEDDNGIYYLNGEVNDPDDFKVPVLVNTDILQLSSKGTQNADDGSENSYYSGITNLFNYEREAVSRTEESSSNVSEKPSAPSTEDSSSDNYTDDFEDDKEEDSLSDGKSSLTKVPDANIISDGDKTKKKSVAVKQDQMCMVNIELISTESGNRAEIIVMKDDCSNRKKLVPSKIDSGATESTKSEQVIDEEKNETDTENNGDTSNIQNCEFKLSSNEEAVVLKPPTEIVDVKKRVSEILANTVDSPSSTRDKNVRCQDYYVTAYDDISPNNYTESVSPVKATQLNLFGNEAEELLKKQLAIEQEIKHLEQQQREQLPFVYIREIPNKPPPPYTPPSAITTPALTVLPSKVEDLNEICNYSSKVLYNAYLSNNLDAVTFSETHFKSINQTKSTKDCCLFVFDLCKEVARSHYKKFEKENIPYWLKLPADSRLVLGKPYGYHQLERHINSKVKQLLGFEKLCTKETSIIKWSRKKKDHVDEVLVLESQAEEHEWLNFDKEELMVKNEVTNEIFDMLLNETIVLFTKIFS